MHKLLDELMCLHDRRYIASKDVNALIAAPIWAAIIDKAFINAAHAEVHKHIAEEMKKPSFLIISAGTEIPGGYLDRLNVKFLATAYPGDEKILSEKLDRAIDNYLKINNIDIKSPDSSDDDPHIKMLLDFLTADPPIPRFSHSPTPRSPNSPTGEL